MTYTITVTQLIPVSGQVLVEADSPEAARQIVRAAITAVGSPEGPTPEQEVYTDSVYEEMVDYIRDVGHEDVYVGDWTVDTEVLTEDGDVLPEVGA